MKKRFRIVTYNTHKSRGLDGRVRPQRICKVLREINPDIVALQEVLSVSGDAREKEQARYFSEELGFHYAIGETRKVKGAIYGNVILSRFPFRHTVNFDISMSWYEQRGCLRADFDMGQQIVHVFNVHLGVDYFERRRQARKLMDAEILHNKELEGARIVLGDFNEWTLGITTQLLRKHFSSVDAPAPSRRIKTFPGFLPVLPLDHIYYDPALSLKKSKLHRTPMALIASDHLPMIAEFELSTNHRDIDPQSE